MIIGKIYYSTFIYLSGSLTICQFNLELFNYLKIISGYIFIKEIFSIFKKFIVSNAYTFPKITYSKCEIFTPQVLIESYEKSLNLPKIFGKVPRV